MSLCYSFEISLMSSLIHLLLLYLLLLSVGCNMVHHIDSGNLQCILMRD